MTEKEILIKQYDTIRSWTMALTGDFTEEEAQKVVEPLNTSLVWNLGHITNSENEALYKFFGQSLLEESFTSRFVSGSSPTAVGNVTKDELLKKLAAVRKALKMKLSKIRLADLNKKPKPKSEFYKNLREAIYVLALHEGYHAGKIGTLRRFLGKPALFG
ncbi:MAG: DinB family protein [candidate division Zixibacteria bacterium]|nr:DinB family protein [candidate division Zixibacteria bacterium]MCI0595837.1 DinB family protein [candidate division Zixibacteria bacterium]